MLRLFSKTPIHITDTLQIQWRSTEWIIIEHLPFLVVPAFLSMRDYKLEGIG